MASYSSHFSVRRLWTILAASMLVMFGTLLYFGREIYQAAPPIPTAVRTGAGDTVFTGEQILRGQNVWQSLGGDLVFACGVLAFATFVVQALLSGRATRGPRATVAVLDPRT